MIPGQQAPEFTCDAVMPDGSHKQVSLNDYKGQYVLLFFWPMDFTFVCPTEILGFNKIVNELKQKNVQLLGCSIDSVFVHTAWRNTNLQNGGIGKVDFPMLADHTHAICRSYGCEAEKQQVALRATYLLDKEHVIRHVLLNDLPLGRSVDEAIRLVDALQHTEQFGEVCPINWKKGSAAMKPNAKGVAEYLSNEFN